MKSHSNISYRAKEPYPPIEPQGENALYANAMLDNVGGMNSEMSAVSLYFYNHIITGGYDEVTDAFHNISIVEMHHLEIFASLAAQLGEDPRLWSQRECGKIYWSPSYNQYPLCLCELLKNAFTSEQAAIRKYEHQLTFIKDENITANLKRIIMDEKIHIELLKGLIEKYCNK